MSCAFSSSMHGDDVDQKSEIVNVSVIASDSSIYNS